MKAVIFAAGKSTRTYPLTINKPKPLLKVANKTLIEHNLSQLNGIIDEAIIVIGYNGEMVKKALGEKFGKIRLSYVKQKELNGTGGALLAAKPYLKDRFIVMNGDDLFSRKDIERCMKHENCVLGKETEDLYRFGELVIEKNKVTEIREKPNKNKGIANAGLYVFNSGIFSYELKKSARGEFEVVDYVKYIKPNYEIVKDFWFPITYPWNLLDANEHFLTRIKKDIKGSVEKGATLKGTIIIGKNTVVKAGSYIEGPAVIGEGCSIGPNCYIRANSTIGNGSKIGHAVEIKNSIIGDNTSIGHLSYVGDSIIGNNVNFGAGTIIANLRHDDASIKSPVKGEMIDTKKRKLGAVIGDCVHTGINTSIYPGRKIWPDKTTLPGEIVKKDLE